MVVLGFVVTVLCLLPLDNVYGGSKGVLCKRPLVLLLIDTMNILLFLFCRGTDDMIILWQLTV